MAIVATSAWAAVILQFVYNKGTIFNFFSYFTILTNLLVAASLTCVLLIPNTKFGRLFSLLTAQTGVALYIAIVAIVANTLLVGLVDLSGIEWVLDKMLHVVNPILYLVFWWFFRTKGTLHLHDGIYWLVYPVLYLVYTMIRGAVLHWYPYPFLNADKLGYGRVSLNIGVMLLVFLAAGLLLVYFTRAIRRQPVME